MKSVERECIFQQACVDALACVHNQRTQVQKRASAVPTQLLRNLLSHQHRAATQARSHAQVLERLLQGRQELLDRYATINNEVADAILLQKRVRRCLEEVHNVEWKGPSDVLEYVVDLPFFESFLRSRFLRMWIQKGKSVLHGGPGSGVSVDVMWKRVYVFCHA